MPLDLTATERRLYALLEDGEAHSADELRECLDDSFMENSTIRNHITHLRKKVWVDGKLIMHDRSNGSHNYRMVRHLNS